MSATKELQVVRRSAEKQGFTVELRRSNHLVFIAPDGRKYFTGGSPSDWRAVHQLEHDLKAFGYVSPRQTPKKKKKRA